MALAPECEPDNMVRDEARGLPHFQHHFQRQHVNVPHETHHPDMRHWTRSRAVIPLVCDLGRHPALRAERPADRSRIRLHYVGRNVTGSRPHTAPSFVQNDTIRDGDASPFRDLNHCDPPSSAGICKNSRPSPWS